MQICGWGIVLIARKVFTGLKMWSVATEPVNLES